MKVNDIEEANKRKLVDSKNSDLMVTLFNDVHTMYDGVFRGCSIVTDENGHRDQRALGRREKLNGELCDVFTWITYEDMIERSNCVASALINKFNIEQGQKSFIGIFSINCPEWMMTAIACYLQSWVIVPLYQTATDDTLAHICIQCELKVCFVKDERDANRLISLKENCGIGIELLVSFENIAQSTVDTAQLCGMHIVSLDQLVEDVDNLAAHLKPKPDDLIIICYTSGTTGTPKGVMLTHQNMISIVSCQTDWINMISSGCNEFFLSYLPLAHILEFGMENFCLCNGFKIGYYSGDVKQMSTDLKLLRPTLFTTVPRVLNRICADIKSKTSWKKMGIFKFLIFKLAYQMKQRHLIRIASNKDRFNPPSLSLSGKKPIPSGWLSTNELTSSSHWTDRIFSVIRAQFGGRLKIILVGSSPSVPEILAYMKVVMGCPIIEGYGQTECCGASHTQPFFDMSTGNVGRALRCCEMKLIDIPDFDKRSKSDSQNQMTTMDSPQNVQGELCIKGYNVFKGYYKDQQTTDLVLDLDGWLHTGDIATICPQTGVVSIIDRKNEIFKLSQGEYIVPNKIESAYYRCDIVLHCLVHGEPYKNYTVAIVVPEKEILLRYAHKQNIISKAELNKMSSITINGRNEGVSDTNDDYMKLCQKQEINQMVLSIMRTQAIISQLTGVERVKRIYIHPEPFTCSEGLLTPTMKVRRSACVKRFRKEIDSMYKE